MKTAAFFAYCFLLFASPMLLKAQSVSSEPKPIVDGTGAFGKALLAKLAADTNGRQKKNVHPFVIGYCGGRVRSLTNYPLTKYDGTQIGLCRAILNYFDAQLAETLTTIEKAAASTAGPADVSSAESKVVRDFVVMKYGMYYIGISDAEAKPDPIARWKFQLGSDLGELAAHLTLWWRIWTNEKFQAKVGSLLAGLGDDIGSIPKGVDTTFAANLRKLNSLGSKVKFAPAERRQVNDLLTQTLVAAVSLADIANIREPIPAGSGNVFATPISPAVTRTVSELLENGRSLSAKGDHKGAIAQFDQATQLDPGNALAYFYRGMSQEKVGSIDEAIRDYSAVILLRSSLREAYYNRGTIYLNRKDHKAAIADFDMVINIDPKYVSAIYNRGLAHYNANSLYASLADFNNVLKLEPKNVNALIMRSNVYCAQGLTKAAARDQELAVQLGGKVGIGCK